MARLESSNVMENEILKAIDVNNGFDAQITNIGKTMQTIFETRQDFIIASRELITPHSENENDWTIDVKPLFGICKNDVQMFLQTAITNVGVQPPIDRLGRVDTVEVRGNFITTDLQKRAFIDFNTQTTSVNPVDTKTVLDLDIRVLRSPDGSVTAPNHTKNWVKVAEIYIPSDATKISDCTIYNITSDVAGQDNIGWTIEKNITYNIGFISEINDVYKTEHNSDGTHKEKIIRKNNIDFGVNSNQVHAGLLPLGENITIGGKDKAATDSVVSALKEINTSVDTGIKALIPTEASTENLLADRGWVNENASVKISDDDKAVLSDSDTFVSMETGAVTSGKRNSLSKLWAYIYGKIKANVKNSEIENDSEFITSAAIPTDISAFNNDANYLTEDNLEVNPATTGAEEKLETLGILGTNYIIGGSQFTDEEVESLRNIIALGIGTF